MQNENIFVLFTGLNVCVCIRFVEREQEKSGSNKKKVMRLICTKPLLIRRPWHIGWYKSKKKLNFSLPESLLLSARVHSVNWKKKFVQQLNWIWCPVFIFRGNIVFFSFSLSSAYECAQTSIFSLKVWPKTVSAHTHTYTRKYTSRQSIVREWQQPH